MADIKMGDHILTNATIQQHVGQTSYGRGRTYANHNTVRQLKWDEAALELSAKVAGSRLYVTSVQLKPAKNGGYLIVGSDCSCPVGYGCKHAAAVALAGRGLLIKQVESQAVVAPQATATGLSAWEKQLDIFTNDAPPVVSAPVAILFELIQTDQYGRSSSYYHHGQRGITLKIQLGMRPAWFNAASGKWALSDISWKNARYAGYGRFNQAQTAFLWELWTLYQSGLKSYAYQDKYVMAGDFNSAVFWKLLQEARRLGIVCLHAGGNREPVTLADDSAAVGMTVRKTPDGGLELTPEIMVGTHPIPAARIGFVGSPAHAIYIWDGVDTTLKSSPIILAPLERSLDAATIEAVKKAEPMQVPAADVPRFLTSQYPAIARKLRLHVPKDLDLELPTLYPPKLLVELAVKKLHKLEVAWSWHYRVGDKTYQLGLRTDSGQEPTPRQEVLEDQLLAQVALSAAAVPSLFETSTQQLNDRSVLAGIDTVRFVQSVLPALKANNEIEVQAPNDLPDFSEFTAKPTIEFGMSALAGSSSTDWFDLSVTVKLADEQVPFELLFTALSDNEEFLVLGSGTYFQLDHPELERLRSLIEEARSLQDKQSDSLRLSPFQAALWDELMALGVVTEQVEIWEKSVKGLLDLQFVPKVAVPKTLKAKLRPYQVEGYQWLHFLHQHNLGGILADDMGLGKTLQTIALLLKIKSTTTAKTKKPVVIVAPTSVAANWISELAKFAPTLNVAYMRTKTASSTVMVSLAKKADVVITTYGLFRNNFDQYQAVTWAAMVLDEAQFVKNHQSKSYQCARKLDAPFKLALTGTPLENNLMELWSLLSVAAPGLFPSPKRFEDFYQKPIEKNGDKDALAQLRRRVRPLMLRRTKDQVATELPPKIEQTLEMELLPDHKKVYDLYLQRERQRVLGMIGDMDKNRFAIFKSITTLRMLSLDARLVDAEKYKLVGSTKLDGLMETLEPVIGEGHRGLVFSQFTSFLKLVRAELDKRKIPYLYLDGATKNRAELLAQFKNSKIPLFLISLKAGGFGLNLTEADYCFLLDPWWNPAVEQQAIDRTHRIGQNKQVIVYRLVAKGTIEEKVMALKARKAKLFKSMMDDDAVFASAITKEDIKGLFEG